MTDQPGLFDMEPAIPAPVEPVEKESADRRRTRRQAEAIRGGRHPLALVFPNVHMHPDADRDATAADGPRRPLRCGTCRFREVLGHHNRAYGKCLWYPGDQPPRYADLYPRVTHSAASDVRAWWPACRNYEPTEKT